MTAVDASTAGRRSGDARGYSWPQFEPQNTAALKHGADSPGVVAPLAGRYVEWVVSVAPWTRGAAFAGTREDWAWTEAQCELIRRYLDAVALLDGEGEVRSAATYLERLARRAASLRNDLGLTPQSMVKLLGSLSALSGEGGGGVADGIEALKATGLEILEAAEQRDRDGDEGAS